MSVVTSDVSNISINSCVLQHLAYSCVFVFLSVLILASTVLMLNLFSSDSCHHRSCKYFYTKVRNYFYSVCVFHLCLSMPQWVIYNQCQCVTSTFSATDRCAAQAGRTSVKLIVPLHLHMMFLLLQSFVAVHMEAQGKKVQAEFYLY